MSFNEEPLASVKKPNETELISNDEFEKRIKAIAKSKRDIVYWAENYFRIIPANGGGLQTIKLYPKQQEMLKCFAENQRIITLSARQCGKCVFRQTVWEAKHKKYNWLKFKMSIGTFYRIVKIKNFLSKLFGFKSGYENEVKLIDTPFRKFISTFKVNNWQIKSENGYEDIKYINKTIKYEKYILILENSLKLECADTHILIDKDHNQVYAKDCLNKELITENGISKVVQVIKTGKFDYMYDFTLEDNTSHCYYSNGILSHNTTTYTIFCLWYASLHPERKIMICANKLATAIEVMDRIRLAYEYLPSWIKPGVTVYNKQELTLSNKSSIRAFATSSSASRGFSAQCVSKWSLITIRFKRFKWLKLKLPIFLIKYFI